MTNGQDNEREQAETKALNFEERLKKSMKAIEMKYLTEKNGPKQNLKEMVGSYKDQQSSGLGTDEITSRENFTLALGGSDGNGTEKFGKFFGGWGDLGDTSQNDKVKNMQDRILNIKKLLMTDRKSARKDEVFLSNEFGQTLDEGRGQEEDFCRKNVFSQHQVDAGGNIQIDNYLSDNYLSGNYLSAVSQKPGSDLHARDPYGFDPKIDLNIRDFQKHEDLDITASPKMEDTHNKKNSKSSKLLRIKSKLLQFEIKDPNYKGESIDYDLSEGDISNLKNSPKLSRDFTKDIQNKNNKSHNTIDFLDAKLSAQNSIIPNIELGCGRGSADGYRPQLQKSDTDPHFLSHPVFERYERDEYQNEEPFKTAIDDEKLINVYDYNYTDAQKNIQDKYFGPSPDEDYTNGHITNFQDSHKEK